MIKHFLKYFIFIIVVFLLIPISVNASFGDLRYEITSVSVIGSRITFEGWAFIHRTNNYDVVKYDGKTVVENGGQKILMRAINKNTKEVIETKIVDGSDKINYNFYCELFYKKDGVECNASNYAQLDNKVIENRCVSDNYGESTNESNSYCYYEDIAFGISFDVSKWNISSSEDIYFQIAASNNDFEKKINEPGDNNYYKKFDEYINFDDNLYTEPVSLYINESVFVSDYETDYIKVKDSSFADSVNVIATYSLLRYYNDNNELVYYRTNSGTIVAINIPEKRKCSSNIFELDYNNVYEGYDQGVSSSTDNSVCKSFLGNDCVGSHNYTIYVDSLNKDVVCPGDASEENVLIVRGSHVLVSGDTVFQINVKNDNYCEIDKPYDSRNKLVCNSSKTLNSVCEELTVTTSVGSEDVRIEQNGTISSVLTPSTTYAGGGFNFGIMYTNTIEWSYVNGKPSNSELHNAITYAMNNKIKSYNDYVSGINITNLRLGGQRFGMIKQCTTSSKSKDYYNKALTVSCIFTFPEASINLDGSVSYNYNGNVDVNNKYYTPINYDGSFKVEASIVGMDRITIRAAKSDSVNGKAWTGTWEDTFYNCTINIYDLIMNVRGNYNFIYRPISITNPFPSRNAGINWFNWYNVNRNKERLENTYSNLQYTANLDNLAINNIKNYNNSSNYLNWNGIYWNYFDEVYYSEFIDDYDYIDRVGDN